MSMYPSTIIALAISIKFMLAGVYLLFICHLFAKKMHVYLTRLSETPTQKRLTWEIFIAIFHLTTWLWLLQSAVSHL